MKSWLQVNLINKVLEISIVYRTWQSLFSKAKIAPFNTFTHLKETTTILDLGCGSGTNAHIFADYHYTGVDINKSYIDFASHKFKGTFIAADATNFSSINSEKFNIVLINSLLDRLEDISCLNLLGNASKWLAKNGGIHILDAIRTKKFSVKSFLEKLDRGENISTLELWN